MAARQKSNHPAELLKTQNLVPLNPCEAMSQLTGKNYSQTLSRFYSLWQNLLKLPERSQVQITLSGTSVPNFKALFGQATKAILSFGEDLLSEEEKTRLNEFAKTSRFQPNPDLEALLTVSYGHPFATALFSFSYSFNSGESTPLTKINLINSTTVGVTRLITRSEHLEIPLSDFSPDLFLSCCCLKQNGLIKQVIRFKNTKLSMLPDHSRYPDIVCLEDDDTNELHVL